MEFGFVSLINVGSCPAHKIFYHVNLLWDISDK